MKDIPKDSRAARNAFLKTSSITPEYLQKARQLNALAAERGQTLAQMAICWLLKDSDVTGVLIGASRPEQIIENIASLQNRHFDPAELQEIDRIVGVPVK